MMEDRVEDVCGVRPRSWTLTNEKEARGVLFFSQRIEDENGKPLSWDEIEAINDEFDIEEINSCSKGRTSSELLITVLDP